MKKIKKIYPRITISILILILVFSYFLFAVQAEDLTHSRIETFTSDGSLLVPYGVTSITFEAWGGGGGGSRNAGGGGGGAYMKKVQSVTAGQTYTVDVGAYGAGGNPLGANGASSTVALFGGSTILIAPPGLAGGATGLGLGGLASNGTGDSGFNGGTGGQGAGLYSGGGGAGTTEGGGNGGLSILATGGDFFGGESPSNISSNIRHYSAGGGSHEFANRDGVQGVVMATYDLDVDPAYPVIKSRAFGHSPSNNTTHTIGMPSGVAVGDLLMIIFSSNGAPTFSDITGWTQLDRAVYSSNVVTQAVFYTIATTTSPALTLTTSASEATTHMTLRIANGGTPVSASSTGFSTNANPPSLNTGASAKYLWIATVARDASAFGSISAQPTSYADFLYLTHPELNANYTDTSIATRHREIQTEDPGTFTMDNQEWVSFTIAVPGSAADGGGPGDSIDTVKTLIKGGTTFKGGVTFQIFLPFFQSFIPLTSFDTFIGFFR